MRNIHLELMSPKHEWVIFITIVGENLANVNSCPIRVAFDVFLTNSLSIPYLIAVFSHRLLHIVARLLIG